MTKPTASFLRGKSKRKPKDPKPIRVTIEQADGQWRTWKVSPGDGVGLGGVRVDIQGDHAILVSRYNETEES